MLRTPLCDLLGIELPIFCAPMGPDLTSPELAAAVSNAGGLGVISFGANPPDRLRQRIGRMRELTSKPFGVNVIVDGPRLPLPTEAFVEVCIGERVPVLSFFWGDATRFFEPAHAAGVKVMDQVGSVAHARRSARAGADVIVAQGVEAGGHIAGEVSTMALVPRVVDAVAPLPVIAAGGVADARGLVAALALGAQGVMMGTRFLATPEALAHPVYKQKLLETTEEQTVRTTLFGHGWPNAPHRTVRTHFVETWLKDEARGSAESADEPIIGQTQMAGTTVPLHRFAGLPPTVHTSGDLESMSFLAGQSVGLVDDIRPAGEIVGEIAAGAEQIIRTLRGLAGA